MMHLESLGNRWRAMLLVGMIGVFIAIAVLAPVGSWSDLIARPETWHGASGIALFGVLYVVWNFALPPAPLQALAGAYYGVAGGLAVIAVSTSVANLFSHTLARRLGRDWVTDMLVDRPGLRAIDRAVEEMGWKGVALLRLSNLIPSNIANFLMGVTGLRLTTILWASILGSIPGWIVMIAVGRSGFALFGAQESTTAQWVLYAVSGVAALALMIGLGWYARKILQRAEESEEADPSEVAPSEAAPSDG